MSYINIDRQTMRITHKHHDREVLQALSWIECVSNCITVPLGNSRVFEKNFTTAELALIYKNATGGVINAYGTGAAQSVHAMALRLPETDCVRAEVLAQAKCIADGDNAVFSYVKGSMRPQQHLQLFEHQGLRTKAEQAEIEGSLVAKYEPTILPGKPSEEVLTATAATFNSAGNSQNTVGNVRKPASTGASTVPGEGTLTARIYARCAAYMQEMACDQETARKEVAKLLMAEGVNASTARRQTSEWAKSLSNQS